MAIVFASNSIADFVGAVISTTASRRRTAYVARSFEQKGSGSFITNSAFTQISPVAGDVTWIHFQYAKTWPFQNGSSDGSAVLELRSVTDTLILDFDMQDGNLRIRLFGSSTLVVNVTGKMDGTFMAVDLKIDLTTDISVELFIDGVSKYNESQAWTSSPGNPGRIFWRIFDATDFGTISQYVSELIVADEDTTGMGLAEMVPNAAGNYGEWQGDHAATGDSETGTGVSTDAINQKLSSDLSTSIGPSSSALRALVVNTKASVRGGTVGELRNFLRIDGTDYNGADMGADGDIKNHITVWDTNPDTASDWDTTDFSGVEIGIESRA